MSLRHFLTCLDFDEYQTLGMFMFPHKEHVCFIGFVFYIRYPTCAFLMSCSCIAHSHILHIPCHPYHAMFFFMFLHHFDLLASLACRVYFILCSIMFLRCFIFWLSFISHSSCTPYAFFFPLILYSFLSLNLLGPFVYLCQKGGEYTRESIGLVHIRRGKIP